MAETTLTKAEIEKQLRKAFPDASDADIKAALPRVTSQKDIKYVIEKKGALPEGFWSAVFTGTDYLSPDFSQQLDAGVNKGMVWLMPAGKFAKVGTGGKALLNLGKSFFAKKAVEEGAKTATKMSLKKKAAIGAVTLYAGSKAAGSIASATGGNKDTAATENQSQAEIDMANAVAAADAAGLDVNQIINTPAGQQLNLSSNNLPAFMAKFGLGTAGLTGIGDIGVFTGTETRGTKIGPKGIVYPTTKSEIVSLADWNKKFPSNLQELAATKQKFVNAGVLDPTAGIDKVKAAWEAYGKMSLEYSRAGNKLSPWQLLDMQKGLSGSGSQTSTTIDVSPIAEADVRTLAKRQLAQSLGLATVDDKMYKDIISIVRKKEAKNPTKTVRTTTGNTTRVKTTPGYGQSDVLADVEAYAKQDPRYSEFQTANVFGDALVKALGLKA
jgi:hypothetical protein